MHTPNLADKNFKKLAAMFPNAVTETITGYKEDGKPIIERAIDADVLRQEISAQVVEGAQERYQFTWPDKKRSVVLANAPIAKTLRLDREKSVGYNGTEGDIDSENIYIEGDNLDALKLLQETYLGKVKMIYIDPPYNTGNDFIYEDDFAQETEVYLNNSGQFDSEGNRLVQNTESNGRFHTDWLNMLYPRLRIAKDFLADDGVIFISIDDNEMSSLRKICDEVFGNSNFIGSILWKKKTNGNNMGFLPPVHDYILCYAKELKSIVDMGYPVTKEFLEKTFSNPDNDPRGPWTTTDLSANHKGPNFPIMNPNTGDIYYPPEGRYWVFNATEVEKRIADGRIIFGKTGVTRPVQKVFAANRKFGKIRAESWWDNKGMNEDATIEQKELFGKSKLFTHPKPSKLIKHLAAIATERESVVFDFFSGSATTAHAVMQLNAEDGGNRKFIMVQLPEETDVKSEAYKAGYRTICEIGEERIRCAGKKIKEETGADIDYGFRVFRVDSSNMEDVYYKPTDYKQEQLSLFADNIKPYRTPEDLLFQVMLDLGILLSSKIGEEEIAGKKVFSVENGYLIACFDKDVTEETVMEIAKRHPFYAVFRDSGLASDSVAVNFEQIFETYSPKTRRKVL
ncbi:MAG: site-specific DNA-methyltransferase [Dorea sp.]|nr:site-specific DNA-methyltransferase [Dorea sp.]